MLQTFLQQVNYGAIIIATIVVFLLGALWYSQILFGKTWMQSVGKSKEELQAGSRIVYLYTALLIFVYCFATSFFVWALHTGDVVGAIKLGLFIGLGYVFTTLTINNLYAFRPFRLVLIDSGYHMTGIVIAAVIMALWR